MLSVIPVQPFANEGANYTCRNREKKCDNIIHMFTSFLLERVDSMAIIAQQKKPVPLSLILLQSWKEFTRPQPAGKQRNRNRGEIGSFRLRRCLWCWRARKVSRLRKIFSGHFVSRNPLHKSCHRQSAEEGCNLSHRFSKPLVKSGFHPEKFITFLSQKL